MKIKISSESLKKYLFSMLLSPIIFVDLSICSEEKFVSNIIEEERKSGIKRIERTLEYENEEIEIFHLSKKIQDSFHTY